MNTRSILALLLLSGLLAACVSATPTSAVPPSPAASATANLAYPPPPVASVPPNSAYPSPVATTPMPTIGVYPGSTTSPNQGATAQAEQDMLYFVVQTSGQTILVLNPNFPLGPNYNPAFSGFLSVGGSAAGVAYVIDNSLGKVLAVDVNGQHDLSFIQSPTYGLAVWRGGEGAAPLLAWGTQPSGSDQATSLMVANPDGSNLQALLTITPNTDSPVQLVAERWSADGQSLYFSKEPVGIGGYILFSGASNLYKMDLATKDVTEIIPQQTANQLQICLDAISGDYREIADHCTQGEITLHDLQSGTTTALKPPAEFSGYQVMGSARFSPADGQVAFALAKNNPDDEQGWLAVGGASGGTAQIIATSDPGNYYNVIGWLNDQTLLVQLISIGNPDGTNQVLAVSVDGTMINKIIDGMFLTVIDNH
jgi:hypothetical protein